MRDVVADASRLVRTLAATGLAAALVDVITMFLPRARPRSYEDFFQTYYNADGVPSGISGTIDVDAFFFAGAAAVELMAALALALCAVLLLTRPDLTWLCRITAPLAALSLVAITIASAISPGLDAPPFKALPAAWVACAAAILCASTVWTAGMLAGRGRSPERDRRAPG